MPARRADLDLCKIDTARLRALSPKQLDKAVRKVGPIYALPKKEHGHSAFRWLLSSFMSNLREIKIIPVSERDVRYSETRFWPEGRAPKSAEEVEAARQHNIRMRQMAETDAAYKEKLIWDLQAQAGCNVRPAEAVARDVERGSMQNKRYEGSTPEARQRADEIRRAERKPTPYKGRRPIIR